MQSKCNKTDSLQSKKFISAYSEKQKIQTTFSGEGRTKQAFKAECDINQILARYQRTGVLDFQQKHAPEYGDVTAIDFQKAQFMIAEAKGMFAAMPAHLRSRFDNDPAKFLAFIEDERNRNEAEDLGLLKEKVKPEAPEAPQGASGKPQANPPARGGGTPHTHEQKGPQGSKTPSPAKPGEGSGEG